METDNADGDYGVYAVHEAMFSSVYDLVSNAEEVLLRMHPIKRKSYDQILAGNATVTKGGKEIRVLDVFLHLNGKTGIVKIDYRSLTDVTIKSVKQTIEVQGFDANGEPIIYAMMDGTVRVVFSTMPPERRDSDDNFDLGNFAADFIYAVGCGAIHDDREVFHVPKPQPSSLIEIQTFLQKYRG